MPGQQPVPQTPPDAGLPFRLDKDGIKAAVAERIPELRECYDAWLEANPSLAGKIKVSFTIAENPDTGLGDVIEIGVLDGGLDHFALQGCVMNVFQDLHFEAPVNGPVKVNYPLSFANAADAGG
ncbi:MAG: AgmX/PglI C-terminal domain-containing protein [Myxococcota bacterium]